MSFCQACDRIRAVGPNFTCFVFCLHFPFFTLCPAESTIRLVGGSSEYQGRLEVFIDGQWGTVCDDRWALTDANVACRQLGFGPAISVEDSSRFGRRSSGMPILMDNVDCTGDETILTSCPYLSNHNCGHVEDVAIVCAAPGLFH